MGHIKEPEGIDFVINSRPLTKKEEAAISEYIKAYKAKQATKQISAKQTGDKKTVRKKVVV